MDNQHKLIKGYRDLSEEEISLMNEAKDMAEKVGELITRLDSKVFIEKRWLNIAKTDLQKGFMCLVRSIAQPRTF